MDRRLGWVSMTITKKALVTGAEGFIGSHLVEFLAGKGWEVIGSVLKPAARKPGRHTNIRIVHCDLRDRKRVHQVLSRNLPTHVFHLGAQSLPTLSWADPVGTFEANIMGSLFILESIRGLKRPPVLVSACSSAEYGNVPQRAIPVTEEQPLRPLHPYGISKVCLDLLAREYFLDYGIRAINIRLFNTTGPGKLNDAPSDFVRQLVRIRKGDQRPVIEVGNLKPRRAFLDVRDAVRGFYLAAIKGKPGESYNLCAASTHSVEALLQTAIRLSGVKAEVEQVDRLMRPSDEKVIFGSTRKFHRDTGWKPKHSLEDTLRSMLHHWDEVA